MKAQVIKVPKICYKEILINNKNVDEFLRSRIGGTYCPKTDWITLFIYVISHNIPAEKRNKALSVAYHIQQNRHKNLMHEEQHWKNQEQIRIFQDFCHVNYYQQTSLYCLDEISAYSAGALYDNPDYLARGVCQETVICSILESSYIFLNYLFDNYMKRYTDAILREHAQNISKTEPAQSLAFLRNMQNTYKNNPRALFDKKFFDLTNAFFTFGNYCVLKDNISPNAKEGWNIVRNNFSQIKQKCLAETSKTIDKLIQSDIYKNVR